MTTKTQGVIALLAILIALVILGVLDADEAKRQAIRYCDNVSLWQATGGQAGWPDYKQQVEEVCK